MSAGRSVGVTLTAGLDSRTILAIAMHAGVPFHTYTYGTGEVTRIDRELSAQLASYVGVGHTVLRKTVKPELLMANHKST